MKHKPEFVGALQAAGLVAYVALIASAIHALGNGVPERVVPPVVAASFFLTLFVTSALICGAIAFGYPITLFFMKDKKREAVETVGWTIGYLAILAILAIFAVAMIPFW